VQQRQITVTVNGDDIGIDCQRAFQFVVSDGNPASGTDDMSTSHSPAGWMKDNGTAEAVRGFNGDQS
jgi:hypothetical protein